MEDVKKDKKSLSCSPCIDALWFCYSPVFQVKQYYREGELDSCKEKWTELFSCISLKTRPASEVEAILKEREVTREHIWQFRSQQAAAEHWEEEFGHLEE
ncbi:hypothetical protein MPTK1_7g00080 [Marchantia polymorpha subsp. ruderalis]|uniref:Uncharacterized protein n=2 Tax=Marchantia polymorpha TaxID=3197 RepID=A0A176WC03_MARPO|nr:hypothetical protein AXG93_942s1070 [Marchantia polymorpha subsp. ruderalis]PTQ39306.1 hypothetical protein MARPO_0046s0116 [Marchantia polymorpha]BBN15701.1 hypothetical protein Mp_7g00080 [Marchantia polymorpha subsp. ruderalis]|eukprot:PTQ39306.1 hypothetical protein MARPO_0046s0116 [Marchantia polymorpha]